MAEQVPFGDIPLAVNNEPRCPCVLLLDVSGSMATVVANTGADLGYTIQQDGKTYNAVSGGTTRVDLLNEGLRAFAADLASDSLAIQRVEVMVITFGNGVQTLLPFTTANQFTPPTLTANGDTPMGAGILKAIEAVEDFKKTLKQNAIHYYRPWIFLITDGEPTDDWKVAAEKVQEGEKYQKFAMFTVGVEGANFVTLSKISVRKPLALKGYSFREMFLWLSQTLRTVSQSTPGAEDQVKLGSPAGWANL